MKRTRKVLTSDCFWILDPLTERVCVVIETIKTHKVEQVSRCGGGGGEGGKLHTDRLFFPRPLAPTPLQQALIHGNIYE